MFENLPLLANGFALAVSPYNILLMIVGVFLGILVGVLPGLGAPERRHSAHAAHLRHEPGVRDHPAHQYVLGGPLRRLDHLDPLQHSGRTVVSGHDLRRAPDGQGRGGYRGADDGLPVVRVRRAPSATTSRSSPRGPPASPSNSPVEHFTVSTLVFGSFVAFGGGSPIKTIVSIGPGSPGVDRHGHRVRLDARRTGSPN